MSIEYYLATTAQRDIWDRKYPLLFLGPWCLANEAEGKQVPAVWDSPDKLRAAALYTRKIYEDLLPQFGLQLNKLHGVNRDTFYWRILLGPWLFHFIEICYERFCRAENAIRLYPDFTTNILGSKDCDLDLADTCDLLDGNGKANKDSYNLKLFSLIMRGLCPEKTTIIEVPRQAKIPLRGASFRPRAMLRYAAGLLKSGALAREIVLTDMYNLSDNDTKRLIGTGSIEMRNFSPCVNAVISKANAEMRSGFHLEGKGKFFDILCGMLPGAVPMSYVENYSRFRRSANIGLRAPRVVGSAVGWYYNEHFKFYAAEAYVKGSRLVEFQHGGGYGVCDPVGPEYIAMDKNVFYTWGWKKDGNAEVKPLPSPFLSGLKDTYRKRNENILFVDTKNSRYVSMYGNSMLPDHIFRSVSDKNIFFEKLNSQIRSRVRYRLGRNIGASEKKAVERLLPGVKFCSRTKLTSLMKNARMVVADHPSTSFLEALVINVPCVFFWREEYFPGSRRADNYLSALCSVGVLHHKPEAAAEQVNRVFCCLDEWWFSKPVQEARNSFCDNFALSSRDWLDAWKRELSL